jgi:hypothetical protein
MTIQRLVLIPLTFVLVIGNAMQRWDVWQGHSLSLDVQWWSKFTIVWRDIFLLGILLWPRVGLWLLCWLWSGRASIYLGTGEKEETAEEQGYE